MAIVKFYMRNNMPQAKLRQMVTQAGFIPREIPWPVKDPQPMRLAGHVSVAVEIDDSVYQAFITAMDAFRTQGIIRILP